MKPPATRERVACLFGLQFEHSAAVYRGVSEFADRHTAWDLTPVSADRDTLLRRLLESGAVDGVIGAFIADRWVRELSSSGLVLVNTGTLSRIESCDEVVADQAEVGRLAAEHLLDSGSERFLYAGPATSHSSTLQWEGYVSRLGEAGKGEEHRRHDWLPDRLLEFRSWISGMAGTPVALFCANDLIARQAVGVIMDLGLCVPEDICVLGVGDSPGDVLLSAVPLSSIVLPGRELGLHAAKLLATRFGAGRTAPRHSLRLRPKRVEQRASTSRLQTSDPLVSRILEYLAPRLSGTLTVDDLAAVAGISRRSLELRFRNALGASPYGHILAMRTELAMTLLRDRSLGVAEVGRRCGYPEPQQFSSFFRSRTGLSPSEWRKN